MTFLPIVARELRIASRRRTTYWMRTGAALVILMLATWCFLMIQHLAQSEVSLVLFAVLTGSAILYCLLAGVQATADCLSQEKREGTLGLLFLTDLKGYDIVAGKLAATSLNAFYCVLAVVPMLAVPLILGGVTGGEFARMTLLAVNTLFFSLAIGICVSAMSRSARKAVFTTTLVILFFAAFLPFCGYWLQYMGKLRKLNDWFALPSAGYDFYWAFDLTYKTGSKAFWGSALAIHAVGWFFLVLATVITPRTWQDRPAGVQGARWRERWQSWGYGPPAERGAFRRQLLDQSAFFWLAARARLKPAYVWAVLGLMGCVWLWGLAKYHRDWLDAGNYVVSAIFLNLLIKNWFASEAGRQLAEDRQQGTLELLLSAPLSIRDIFRGQRLALQRQFLGPVVAVLFVECLFLLAPLSDTDLQADRTGWMVCWVAVMVMLPADLAGLYWVGMWQGLTASSPQRAARSSKVRILVLPWVIFALATLVASLVSLRTQNEPGWKFYLGLWFGLGIGADILFGAHARHKLLLEFRSAAAQRYTYRAGFWQRLAGPQVERT